MTRAQKRKIAILAVLVILLGLLGAYFAYYQATHKLSFNIAPVSSDAIEPPQFLYSFSGTDVKLQRPIGVYVEDRDVYVVDSAAHTIFVFDENGNPKRSFGTSQTVVPLYVAKNPKTNVLYVSDRRARTIWMFTREGKYLGEFKPNLPKEQLPTFSTKGVVWAPVAIAFAPDGTMYVTETLKGHRLLIFGPDGAFKRSVGNVGIVVDANSGPGLFQFPNGVVVHKNEVYVTDSNNRRVQVFDLAGEFKRIIVTQGLPRGIDFLQRFPSDKPSTSDRFVVVDTLSHDGTIWSAKGEKIVNFGEQGILDGQFNYPNAVSVGRKNKIFISDTSNGRVQVWGWPNLVSPVPVPTVPRNWGWCLTPLLLLPFLLLLRRKRFYATADFVHAMVDAQQADLMRSRRRRWFVSESDYELLKDLRQGDVDMAKLLEATPFSESDVKGLMDKLEIDRESAIVLALAKRARVFCTEDGDYRRLAKVLEIDVVNRTEFLERFVSRRSSGSTPGGSATIGSETVGEDADEGTNG